MHIIVSQFPHYVPHRRPPMGEWVRRAGLILTLLHIHGPEAFRRIQHGNLRGEGQAGQVSDQRAPVGNSPLVPRSVQITGIMDIILSTTARLAAIAITPPPSAWMTSASPMASSGSAASTARLSGWGVAIPAPPATKALSELKSDDREVAWPIISTAGETPRP